MDHDPSANPSDLFPLPPGMRARAYRFGANPVSPLFPAPPEGGNGDSEHTPAHYIKISAKADGSFRVTNERNGFVKEYKAEDGRRRAEDGGRKEVKSEGQPSSANRQPSSVNRTPSTTYSQPRN